MSARILILAGSYKQALAHANFKNLKPGEWIFPLEPEDCLKYNVHEILFTGTYEQRPHAVEFLKAACDAMTQTARGRA